MGGKLTVEAMGYISQTVVRGRGSRGGCAFSVSTVTGWTWSVWSIADNRRFRTLEEAAEWLDTLPPYR